MQSRSLVLMSASYLRHEEQLIQISNENVYQKPLASISLSSTATLLILLKKQPKTMYSKHRSAPSLSCSPCTHVGLFREHLLLSDHHKMNGWMDKEHFWEL